MVRFHGVPKNIVSERDAKLTSKLLKELFVGLGTKFAFTIAYPPQTDGQIEVVNRIVIQFLRGYCSKHSKLWDEHLCYVQHAYNRAKNSSTQRSPFETFFGFTPKSPLDFVFDKI